MSDTESQKDLWKDTTGSAKNDLEIPMDVISTQTNTLTQNWVNGFTQMMFEDVKYKNGEVDLSSPLKPKMLNINYDVVDNGVLTTKSIDMPMIGAVDYPAMALNDVELNLNYEVSTSDSLAQNASGESAHEAGANGGIFGIGIKASTNFKLSHSEERTRKTDTRAKLNVIAKYSRVKTSEAISRIADVLMNSALGSSTNTSDS